MSTILQNVWGALTHPGNTFSSIAADPSLGAATLLLFFLYLLSAVTLLTGQRLRGYRNYREQNWDWRLVGDLSGATLVLLSAWLWITLLTLGITRGFQAQSHFEAVFCLLLFASLPQFLFWLSYPLRNLHPIINRVWQVLTIIALLWLTALVPMALHTGYALPWWKAVISALPLVGSLWGIGIYTVRILPVSFLGVYVWKRSEGKRVVVFTPPGKRVAEIEEIVQGCDWTLHQAALVLEVDPLPYKVYVFLFPDAALHQRITETEGKPGYGYAHGDSISGVYGPWSEIYRSVAHEFGHVLREQQITPRLSGLLDEGLAQYVEDQVYREPGKPLMEVKIPTPLRDMARPQVFFEWYHAQETEYASWEYYAYARHFARFLIERSGLAKYKQLCKEAVAKGSGTPGEQLANAVQKVYGTSLKKLEQEWRGAVTLGQLTLFRPH